MRIQTIGMMASLLFLAMIVQAAPYHIWNGSVSTNWHDAGNWTVTNPDGTSAVPTIADVAFIDDVPANIPTLSTTESTLTLRVAYSAGKTGVLNIMDGANLTVASNYDRVGNGGHGTVNQSGGTVELNRMQLGNGSGAYGEWNLSGGTFKIKNTATLCGLAGMSLGVGDQGDGVFNLSGGTLITKGGIALGGTTSGIAEFNIGGAGLVQCGHTDTSDSGSWFQNNFSTLSATVDSDNGFSLGQIVLFDGFDDNPSVTFESGSRLDVSFSGADMGSNTMVWDLMTWPAGTTVSDLGLSFSSGVDLVSWSFAITNNALRITYGVGSPTEPPVSANTTFVHPGLSHKRSDLDRMKAMVEAQIDPWYTSYQTMAAESKASYNYTVQGNATNTVLLRDAPKTNLSEFESDSRAAYYNALRWYIEGDSRYADKCVEIFNAWTGLTYMGHTGTRALTSSIGYQIIEAAEIIKSTYSGWSTEDIDQFKAMLVYPGYSNTERPATYDTEGTFYWRCYLFDYVRAGNQEISAMRVCMAMGIFLDNEIMYDRALRYAKGLPHRPDDLPYSSGPHTTGSEINNDGFRISYNYSIGYDMEDYGFNGVLTNYIWETGQSQESSRDLWHTWWGMHMLGSMSEMAWSQSEDLWSEADSRILLGSEYHNRYCVSYVHSYPDQPSEWTPTAASGEFLQQFDRTGRTFNLAISPLYNADPNRIYRDRYDEVACWELNTAHYVGRGLKTSDDVKWTLRARDTAITMSGNYETKPSSGNGSYLGYGGLTYRRPDYCYGDPVGAFDANDLPVYAQHEMPGKIEAENFDYSPVSRNGRTYHDSSIGNSGHEYRPDEDVDIVVCSEGGYALTDLQDGEWVSYTVHVPTSGKYRLAVRYAATGQGTIRFSFGGNDVTGDVVLPTTGSSWTTHTVARNMTLNEGVQSMRIYVSGGGYELNSITIAADETGAVPVATPTDLSASPETASQINLMWAATVGASVYNLKRSTNSGGPYDTMVIGPATTNHSDAGLLAGTNYYYVVSALYDGVESTNSAEVMAVPSAPINQDDIVVGPMMMGDTGSGGIQWTMTISESGLGHNYQLKSSESLTDSDWQVASDVLKGTGGELPIIIPIIGSNTNRFYKLEAWRQ